MKARLLCHSLAVVFLTTLDHVSSKNAITFDFVQRSTSLPGNRLDSISDYNSRIGIILQQIRQAIPVAIKSIQKDVRETNVDNVILSVSNFLGAWFGVFGAFNGYYSVGALPIGYKFKLAAQLLYGYGFVTPFAFEYDQTNLNCGSKELESVLEEFEFLENPAEGTSPILLTFYTSKLNHEFKRKLNCIVSKKGSNKEALVLNSLLDFYTELVQEKIENSIEEEENQISSDLKFI